MTGHTHQAIAETAGHWAEACECGAVRLLDRRRNACGPWHARHLCCRLSQEGPKQTKEVEA
jgi:hypothetical protein